MKSLPSLISLLLDGDFGKTLCTGTLFLFLLFRAEIHSFLRALWKKATSRKSCHVYNSPPLTTPTTTISNSSSLVRKMPASMTYRKLLSPTSSRNGRPTVRFTVDRNDPDLTETSWDDEEDSTIGRRNKRSASPLTDVLIPEEPNKEEMENTSSSDTPPVPDCTPSSGAGADLTRSRLDELLERPPLLQESQAASRVMMRQRSGEVDDDSRKLQHRRTSSLEIPPPMPFTALTAATLTSVSLQVRKKLHRQTSSGRTTSFGRSISGGGRSTSGGTVHGYDYKSSLVGVPKSSRSEAAAAAAPQLRRNSRASSKTTLSSNSTTGSPSSAP